MLSWHRIPLEGYLVIEHMLATAMQEMNLSQLLCLH